MSALAEQSSSTDEGFSGSEPLTNTSPESLSSGEQAAGITPTRWEQFAAALNYGLGTGTTGSLMRMDMESVARDSDARQGVTKLTPNQANQLYPGLPVPFNENVSPQEAQIKYDLWKRDQKAQDWISRGGSNPFTTTAAGLVAGAVDPINLALGLATGGAMEGLGIANTVKNVFLSNLGMNALGGALSYYQEKQDQRNPSIADSVTEAVGGAIGGTALHFGIQGLLKLMGRGIEATPADIREQNLKTAVGQEESGARIDTTIGDREAESRKSTPYLNTVERIPENTHFVGIQNDGTFIAQDPNLGPGIQTSSNGHLMNNLASDLQGGGYVGKLKIPEDTKFFNLDRPAAEEYGKEGSFLKAAEKEFGIDLKPEEGESIKDVIDRIHSLSTDDASWHEAMGKIQDILKSEGYVGYEFNGTDAGGQVTDARKHLFLADNRLTEGQDRLSPPQLADQRIQPGEGYQANEDIVPRISADEKIAAYQESVAPQNGKYTTPDLEKEVHDLRHGPATNSTPDYMDSVVEEQIKNSKAMLDRLAESDPDLKAELDEIYREHATDDRQQQQAMQTLADCVMENMV